MFKLPPAKQDRGALGAMNRQVGRSISLPNFGNAIKRKTAARNSGLPVSPARPRSLTLPRVALDRYSVGLVAALLIGFIARLPGILAEPTDAPSAQQATFAAFVRGLAHNGGNIKAALPWQGGLPADVTGGLPLFSWLAALPAGLIGVQPFIGRGISLVAALLATLLLFNVVRRLAGGRAALFAALFMSVSPFALYYGRAYLPEAFGWAAACGALAAALRWQDSLTSGQGTRRALVVAAACGALAVVCNPANLALLPLLLYLARPWYTRLPIAAQRYDFSPAVAHGAERRRITLAWTYLGAVVGPLLLWWLLTRVGEVQAPLADGYGAGGISESMRQWFSLPFYGLLLGQLVNNAITLIGFLLLLAGLWRRARTPWPWALHLWALGALLMVLFAAGRLANDEAALAVLIPPLAALAGVGAAWLASLPAQIAAATRGRDDFEAGDASDPVSAADDKPVRGAVRRREADPMSLIPGSKLAASWESTRDNMLRLGNAIVLALLAIMFYLGLGPMQARYAGNGDAAAWRAAGANAALTDAADGGKGKAVVVGSGAAEIFYGSGLSGWALSHDEFSRARLNQLIGQGATMLITVDQDWLNHHPDYPGLPSSFVVATLQHDFIAFDLKARPSTTESSYYLETGHTLRGSFRVYWDSRGGVNVFGYPISEEIKEANPDDGVVRTVQYFERAVLELHPENAGTAFDVMPAPVGRWLLQRQEQTLADQGVTMSGVAKVPEFTSSDDNNYFPESGHSVHGEFLKVWNAQGGVNVFGYPLSEERREVNPADGKVYIVQYFERARFEWHEEFSGTPNQVQLGLVGKEWLAIK